MYFATLADLLYMDGHGVYVWSVYAVAMMIIGTLIVLPMRDRRHFLREEAQRLRRQGAQARPGASPTPKVTAPSPRLSTQWPNSGG